MRLLMRLLFSTFKRRPTRNGPIWRITNKTLIMIVWCRLNLKFERLFTELGDELNTAQQPSEISNDEGTFAANRTGGQTLVRPHPRDVFRARPMGRPAPPPTFTERRPPITNLPFLTRDQESENPSGTVSNRRAGRPPRHPFPPSLPESRGNGSC